jgi:CHASE2 domain-containing sensor protein
VLFILVRRGYKGSCACFGAVDKHQVGVVHLIRNVVLILATAFALTQSFTSVCVHLTVWNLPPLVPATAMVLLIVTGLLYVLAAEVEAFFKNAARQPLATQKRGSRHV